MYHVFIKVSTTDIIQRTAVANFCGKGFCGLSIKHTEQSKPDSLQGRAMQATN